MGIWSNPRNSPILNRYYEVPANKAFSLSMFGIAKVTTAGTLALRFGGHSVGSEATVASGEGQMHAIVLNNG